MRRAVGFLAAWFFIGSYALAWAQDKTPASPKKVPDGVYAVLRESLKEKEVLPLKEGEVLLVHDARYLKKDEKEPPRFLVVHSTPDIVLDLAGKPKAIKEGKEVVRILLKLQPKAAAALERLTRDHLSKQVAIVVGGEVVTMHKIREVIKGGDVQITSCAAGAASFLLEQLEAQDGAKDSRQKAPPGKLIDIGGYRLHLHCLGEGSPAVVLLYGGGGRAADFDLVQPAVAQFTRACAYDRAGDGWSESGPLPRTLRQNAYELHTLLQKAGVNGLFVLAGQSYGGLLAREYARHFPKEVAGLVLIDSMHEDGLFGVIKTGKVERLRLLSSGKPIPPIQRELAPAGKAPPQENDFLAEEFAEISAARQNTKYPLSDTPLIVLSAGVHHYPKGANVSAEDMAKDKERLQADLTTLSRNSKQIIAKKSGHAIHRDEPHLVIDAIREVVEAVRAGKPLPK